MKPTALIPWFPGTNCHGEMARAFEVAGAKAEIIPHRLLLDGMRHLTECDLVGLAGGFSFGDHLGAGRIAAHELRACMLDQLQALMAKGTPIIGVCNGFQILVAAGLLPGSELVGDPTALLDLNLSGRFEHWSNGTVTVHEVAACPWTEKLGGMEMKLPWAHAEGRLVGNAESFQVAVTYGQAPEGEETYPTSPSGSRVAGIAAGPIFGLMPHPERRIDDLHGGSDGLKIFEAGVRAVR